MTPPCSAPTTLEWVKGPRYKVQLEGTFTNFRYRYTGLDTGPDLNLYLNFLSKLWVIFKKNRGMFNMGQSRDLARSKFFSVN